MTTPTTGGTATTPGEVDRMRVLTSAITAPQQQQSIGGRSLRGGVKRLRSNFSNSCSKPIRRLQLACRKPKLRARRNPLGSTCWTISQRKSAPARERCSSLPVSALRIAKAHPAVVAGEDVLLADDAAVEVTTEVDQGLSGRCQPLCSAPPIAADSVPAAECRLPRAPPASLPGRPWPWPSR